MKPMNLKNLPNTVLPNTKIISKVFKNIFGYLGQKYFIPRIPISGRGLLFCCSSLEFLVLTHSYSLITMGQLTDAHKAQILAYRNANLSMAEIGRKIGFSKTAIYKFLSSYTGGMSASGDFSVPMSFPRKCDPGTGTKNRIVTNRQLSIMRIQILYIKLCVRSVP